MPRVTLLQKSCLFDSSFRQPTLHGHLRSPSNNNLLTHTIYMALFAVRTCCTERQRVVLKCRCLENCRDAEVFLFLAFVSIDYDNRALCKLIAKICDP